MQEETALRFKLVGRPPQGFTALVHWHRLPCWITGLGRPHRAINIPRLRVDHLTHDMPAQLRSGDRARTTGQRLTIDQGRGGFGGFCGPLHDLVLQSMQTGLMAEFNPA